MAMSGSMARSIPRSSPSARGHWGSQTMAVPTEPPEPDITIWDLGRPNVQAAIGLQKSR
jgi:hypothetical protein